MTIGQDGLLVLSSYLSRVETVNIIGCKLELVDDVVTILDFGEITIGRLELDACCGAQAIVVGLIMQGYQRAVVFDYDVNQEFPAATRLAVSGC